MLENRIPITLITGFLGAGKSTLLNTVLAHPDTERVAVIINEYGDVGLDHALIEHTEEDVTLLASGCICCKTRRDLVAAIQSLVERRNAGAFDFTRIIIETTGLADPVPIHRSLSTDPSLTDMVYLDGVITLVDAVNGARSLEMQREAMSQAVMADLILLTKTDIAEVADVAALRARLARLNAQANMSEVGRAAQDPKVLWGCAAMRPDATASTARSWTTAPGDGDVPHPPGAQAPLSAHEAQVNTASLVLDRPLAAARFETWISDLIAQRGEDLLRVKGVVFIEGEATPWVFHAVQHVFDGPVPLEHWSAEDRSSKVVIIARNMSDGRLRRTLNKLAA